MITFSLQGSLVFWMTVNQVVLGPLFLWFRELVSKKDKDVSIFLNKYQNYFATHSREIKQYYTMELVIRFISYFLIHVLRRWNLQSRESQVVRVCWVPEKRSAQRVSSRYTESFYKCTDQSPQIRKLPRLGKYIPQISRKQYPVFI